ncbi:MAG: ABC transporter permease [Acidimicrobiales bacterium]|nr:ABC transporter permease [Acidimicrobiales bacterium]RZV48665.1 MAG: ABC transporter permease [Acidimicrobiales bacterium]
MIQKIRFLLAETGQNIWRNLALTLASIIVVGVSLSLFGSSQLVARGVDNATRRWEGGIEFVVFMRADAEQSQLDAIEAVLDESTGNEIDSWVFVDKAQTFDEFKEYFAGDQELLDTISVDTMPPSFRIRPTDPNAGAVEALGSTFEAKPGVRTVVFATEVIREIQSNAEKISRATLWAGVTLLFASTIMILTTLSIAIASRRNEIEIMKLVGASNWFIRIPFMIEGMIQGVIGALIALPGLAIVRTYLIEDFSKSDVLRLLEGFRVTDAEFLFISLGVLGIGTLVATIGSIFAVSRYLDV